MGTTKLVNCRGLNMKYVGDRLIYSPRDIVQFYESEFACWMERYYLDVSAQSDTQPDPRDEMLEILAELGNTHEQDYLNLILQTGEDVYCVSQFDDGSETWAAMQSGHHYIYQASLQAGEFGGYSDFLVRVEQASVLGNWSYIPVECKLAINPKPHFVIQACAYCDLLAEIQRTMPKTFRLWLGHQPPQTFREYRVEDYIYYFRSLKHKFLQFMTAFNPAQRPIPQGSDHGRWNNVAKELLLEQDHLSQVANITRTQIRKLEAAGIMTLQQLADATPDQKIPKLDPQIFARLQHQASLQQQSVGQSQLCYAVLAPDPDHPQRGLALLPPTSPLDVYFDMEGYPLVEGGLEYLFGVVYEVDGNVHYQDWWAHNSREEKQAFEQFIDWVYGRWLQDPTMHIYHYAPYETTAVKKLMGRYATREEQVDNLLRNRVFVDLYRVVRQGIRVGGANYSIKTLEKIYWSKQRGEGKDQEVTNAQDSVIQYFHWMQKRDRHPAEADAILKSIHDYNQDDCESTLELAQWLRQLQTEYNIPYLSNPIKEQPSDDKAIERLNAISAVVALAEELLGEIPADGGESGSDMQRWQIQELLAYLLDFYRREDKPFWWQRYAWLEMEEDELFDELDCLAGIERTATEPYKPTPRSRSQIYEYCFDPQQETKLTAEKICWFVPAQPMREATINTLDPESGILTLRISQQKLTQQPDGAPPQRTSLIDAHWIDKNRLSEAILETVKTWQASQQLPSSLQDFLERRSPRIRNHPGGNLLSNSEASLEQIIHAVLHLDNSALCIQGPPGSGKTFTAAHMILRLIQSGKTVAVSANSHKVIENLLGRVAALAKSEGVECRGAKVGRREQSDTDDLESRFPQLSIVEKMADAHPPMYQLVGATAFQCCRDDNQNVWDYLFVDEAGQVSLANLVAKSRCARNLVLMGDQMQLEQPIQGSHPGESGVSGLGYFLQDRATIPPDLGIFLEFSYRMHPDICQFISTLAYDDRLTHHPATYQHRITLPTTPYGRLPRGTGIVFIPVEHEDNRQASAEEVDVIDELVVTLTGLDYVSDRGSRQHQIGAPDILIVAPYNLQVLKLKEKIGDRARIGTVDKFQGQEAPVVIVSMCASSGDMAPRGLDFLLNRNRLNVAISRAQCLSIVVGNPALAATSCTSIHQMGLVNIFCKLMAYQD